MIHCCLLFVVVFGACVHVRAVVGFIRCLTAKKQKQNKTNIYIYIYIYIYFWWESFASVEVAHGVFSLVRPCAFVDFFFGHCEANAAQLHTAYIDSCYKALIPSVVGTFVSMHQLPHVWLRCQSRRRAVAMVG